MIPAAFTGGWIRNGIALDGAPPAEDELVWWLQAPTRHCDLRVSRGGGDIRMCFAGVTSWAEPMLTWTHDLELDASDAADIGTVAWDGDDLLESGSFVVDGREARYVERWQRLPGSAAPLWALSSPTGRIVRAGNYALTVVDARGVGGQFAARAWTLDGGAWRPAHGWPVDADVPAPPLDLPGTASIVELDDGRDWLVDETG